MLYTLLVRDIFEICFYSLSIFATCKWLKIDKTKNLLCYFFIYSILMISAWIIELPTLAPFLFAYAPIAILLFIVLHEKTLQRNLISLCSITPSQYTDPHWIDTIISSCLTLINNNKAVTIIIEHTDALDYFLDVPCIINADINKKILDILLSSTSYDEQKMIWISAKGKIRSINASWKLSQDMKDDFLFYTLQSDALILVTHAENRSFRLIMDGKEISHLTAHQVKMMIKKQFSRTSLPKHKGAFRENNVSEKSISR